MTETETVADAMLRAAAVLEAHAESEEGTSRSRAIMRDVRALRDGRAELATLRAQLAGVRERVEKLERFTPDTVEGRGVMVGGEFGSYGNWIDRDDVLAALEAP